ncbi:MAG TPA: excinuclease ABC subunit UvrC [Nitrospiria bacterium]|nr:excinuclease ABC subunit UvrC [Nitrospiria bacterium]
MATILLDKHRDPAGRLPKSPGVYLMKGQTGAVLYVGKANRLADRVRSYFQKGADHTPKTVRMVQQIAAIDYIVTGSELEALILENNLIKKHRPRFNIILRDDKNYPFLRLPMKDDYPRLEIIRKVKPDGALYFGPYVPTHSLRETLRWLRRIFPLPNCTITIDGTADRPCIEYEIKRCLAPCTGHQSQVDYKAMLNQVRLFLEGRETELQEGLRARMEAESARLNFEEAARIRDQIAHIDAILEKQRITSTKLEDQDVWAIVSGEHDNARRGDPRIALTFVIQLLFIRAGMIVGRKEFYLREPPESEPAALLTSAIEHYYGRETVIPPEIVVSMALPEQQLLMDWLKPRRGGPVTFRVPQRGHDRDLVKLAEENGRAALAARGAVVRKESAAAAQLQQVLGLGRVPRRIEAFDISNLAADQAVGACVVWDDDQFRPEDYRHVRMRQTAGPNDFGMMAEMVHRRYARAIGTAGADATAPRPDLIVPDLIVIDGGKGQLSAAVNVLQQLGLDETDVIGLAKERGEKFERVYLPDESEPVVLTPGHPATHLLQRIRDEAHRFAISYHRKLRGKALVVSVLDDIPGLGKARKVALLRRFGSLAKLRAASREEIEAVKGIPTGLARLIVEKLKSGSAA